YRGVGRVHHLQRTCVRNRFPRDLVHLRGYHRGARDLCCHRGNPHWTARSTEAIMIILAIAIAGGVGAALRAWIDSWCAGRSEFPWAVMGINLSGSALIGLVAGLGFTVIP